MRNLENVDLPPIFIGGMFKSGTSLLRAMIGNHTAVAAGLETYWFDLDWKMLHQSRVQERLRIIGKFYELDQNNLNDLVEMSSSAEDFLSQLMKYWVKFTGKFRWAEKTPGNIIHIDRIRKFWPSARIVHVVRDPRDIFASLQEAKKWDQVDSFMERWSKVFKSVERFDKIGLLNQENYVEIRYEDLVSNPEDTIKSICEFVALPYEPRIALFKGQKDDFDKVMSVTGKKSTTLARLAQPMTTDRLGIWKSVLSASDIHKLSQAATEAGLANPYERVCL